MRALIALVIGIAAFGTADARAQIVNVQSVLATKAEPGLSGSVQGSIDWQSGNVDLLRLTTMSTARYLRGPNLVVGILKGDLGRASGARYIAKTFEHLRYRFTLSDLVVLESFAQHEYDQFRRLELRALIGVGVALRVLRGKELNLTWGLAYMPEYERLRNDDQADAEREYIFNRASTYVSGAVELDKRIQLVQTFYWQPRLDEPEDFRFLSESQFVVQISKRLTQTTAMVFSYDSRPPLGIAKLDTTLKSAFTFSF